MKKHKRVYIAAPYELIKQAESIGERIISLGHEVTSRWITGETPMQDNSFEENNKFACMDLDDIDSADVFLLLNPPGWEQKGTGGRHWETGVAFSRGKEIIILGVRSNIFHWFLHTIVVETIDQAMVALGESL
jgi:nucleoside 2-deoxyribosyltransferase